MENKATEAKKTVQKRMEPELKLINMDTVEVEQIEWLLYPFIPYGKVTIIQGDPGEGKTTMVLQIIAKLTRGEAILPTVSLTDDKENTEVPVNVIYQTAARSVLIVGRIKEEPETRVVCHTKSSLAPEGKSIAFRLDKDNGFEWIGEYDISADELLNGDGKGQKSRKAKEFLLEILADGGMSQKKILEEAAKRGIKGKTLRNAKSELEVDSVKRGNQWYWVLPE